MRVGLTLWRKIIEKRFTIIVLSLFIVVGLWRYHIAIARPLLWLDESAYLARGVAIAEEGKFPKIADSPGVSYIHALSYFFLKRHPLGMDYAGRVTSFLGGVLLCALLYLAVQRSLGRSWGMLSVVLSLLYYPLYYLDHNSSDFLFALTESALLVFWVAIEQNRTSFRPIIGLSIATAVSVLMRNDGFLIFIGLTPLMWLYFFRFDESLFRRGRIFISYWLLPFIGVISIAAYLAWRSSGSFEVFPISRTYVAFEQGAGLVQRFALDKEGKNPWIEGSRISHEVFGTREENKGSVLLAVLRHPRAWSERIRMNIRDFFLRWFEVHNGRLTTVTLLLSWFGWITWLKQRRFFLFASVGSLFLSTLPYFIFTFWRSGYISMHSPLILFLSLHAIASLKEEPIVFQGLQPNQERDWKVKIILGGISVIILAALIWYAAKYSDYTYGPKGRIDGISQSEIVSGAIVWWLFIWPILVPQKLPKVEFRIAGIAFILGIWLAANGDIFSLAFSDRTMAKRAAEVQSREMVYNYIRFAFNKFRGVHVCVDDPSLPWYARQKPIILYELYDQSIRNNLTALINLMKKNGCEYLLWTTGNFSGVDGLLEPVFAEGGITLLKLISTELNGSETVLEDFDEMSEDRWSAFGMNNVQGKFTVQDGILTLAYENNVSQWDIYAYVYNLPQPLAGVVAVKMRVKIYPGTLLTVDIVKNGELVSPRFLNYYPGTGEWEEIIIPVGGRLDSITIGIGELDGHTTTPSYRIEIDWIKAIVSK